MKSRARQRFGPTGEAAVTLSYEQYFRRNVERFTAWRHRRLMWQLQAAFIGGGVGFVAGRLTAGKGSDK